MIQKVNDAHRVEPAENSNETSNDQNSTCEDMKYLFGDLFENPNKELYFRRIRQIFPGSNIKYGCVAMVEIAWSPIS
jgi:hypothetical protein